MKVLFLVGFLAPHLLLFSQETHAPKELPITKAAFATIKLAGYPDFLAADGDDVWILNDDRVEKLSANSNKPVLSAQTPGACGALIVGFNSLWVANCSGQSIYRIDDETGKLLSVIPCGVSDPNGELMLAVGDSSLWVLSDSAGVLTRIDPKTNTVQAKIAVLADSHCAVYGFGAVWITNTSNNSVQKIDPKTNMLW